MGDTGGMVSLGAMALKGLGMPANASEALRLFQKVSATRARDHALTLSAGDVAETPRGLQRHGIPLLARSAGWFTFSSSLLSSFTSSLESHVTRHMSHVKSPGIGVEQDMKRAKDCFDRAMEFGRSLSLPCCLHAQRLFSMLFCAN
jgi:TPR repeat protein